MEEQKKNDGNERGNGSHKSHRHGYFIEPPKQKKNGSEVHINPAPSNEQTAERGADNDHRHRNKKNKNRRPNHHKQHKSGDQQAGRDNAVAAEQRPEQKVDNRTEKKSPAESSSHKKNKNHSQHKNHKNSSQGRKNDKPEQATAQRSEGARQDKKRTTSDILIMPRSTPAIHSDEYEEYKLVFDDDERSADTADGAEAAEAPKTEVVGIRFKSTGKVYYFDPAGNTYAKGTSAIVDTARGQEFGEVAMTNTYVNSSDIVPPLRTVVRSATEADIAHNAENKKKEAEAFKICTEKIAAHKLEMKLIDAQYTFDNSKLLFYFTSADRVDFRNLVKDLASVFRTRIELRQIGIRDEAKLVGGLGMCGRPLCCTIFLSDFDQVSIKMAKEQNLSLNSAKISGICGRLMCCLRYEHEAYEYEIKRTPPVDSLVRTENGDGVVTEINPLRRTIKVRLLASPEVPPKTYNRDEVTMLRKKQKDNK